VLKDEIMNHINRWEKRIRVTNSNFYIKPAFPHTSFKRRKLDTFIYSYYFGIKRKDIETKSNEVMQIIERIKQEDIAMQWLIDNYKFTNRKTDSIIFDDLRS